MLSGFKGIALPADSEFVLVDNTVENDLPIQGPIQRIPFTMWIDYNNEDIDNPPAVTLLINPSSMSTSCTKKINTTFTRGGYVVEQWGENLDVISFSGTIGAYYVLTNDSSGTGLNRYNRNNSYSFRNLMELFLIYRSNGALFLKQESNEKNQNVESKKLMSNATNRLAINQTPNPIKTVKTRISSVGDVYIQYDKTLYFGSFDAFSIEEDAARPFNLNYTFTFTVLRKTVADNRNEAYYGQMLLDMGDQSSYTANYSSAIQSYISIEKDSLGQQSLTNPDTFNDYSSRLLTPEIALAQANKDIEQKGYRATPAQQSSLLSSFKDLNTNQTYKESEKTKDDVYKINRDIVEYESSKGITPEQLRSSEEKAKDARELAEAQLEYAKYKPGAK